MTIRSNHNSLLNYFLHDDKDLSKAYVRKCKKFLKEISRKRQATSLPQSDDIVEAQQKGIK